jgi:hypothetical protein
MMSSEHYSLLVSKGQTQVKISVKAFDAAHAQAQALDIARSLEADRFELGYGAAKENKLSELFEKLAYNDFDHKECYDWKGSLVNKVPAVYTLNKRFYVRPLILGYLDISKDAVVKNVCRNPLCVNPYHNQYLHEKNSKIGGGDLQMLLAFRSQGASVPQIAKALNVHRSTIYRILKDERFSSGT